MWQTAEAQRRKKQKKLYQPLYTIYLHQNRHYRYLSFSWVPPKCVIEFLRDM